MKVNLDDYITGDADHGGFTWREALHSDSAERFGLVDDQHNPSSDVVSALVYHFTMCVHPIRALFDWPLRISSGFRSPRLNAKVGGSSSSQHMKGEATDIQIVSPARFLSDPKTLAMRERLRRLSSSRYGVEWRDTGLNAEWFLWAFIVLHLDELDVDQVIHEFGTPGRPAWVHVASSARQDRRRATVVGTHTGRLYVDVSQRGAMELAA